MSEKIYTLLLNLYPSRFRKSYKDEALQLFRDRARDEKGFFPSLRLWMDLLADLASSIPSEYYRAQPALVVATSQQPLDGTPSFHVLEHEVPHFRALLSGGILSLVVFGSISVVIGHSANHRPLPRAAVHTQGPTSASSFSSRRPAARSVHDAGEETMVSGQSATADDSLPPNGAKRADLQSDSLRSQNRTGFSQLQAKQTKPQNTNSTTNIAVDVSGNLDAAQRHRVIDAATANLRQYYIYSDVAQKMADALLTHEKSGDDDALTSGTTFADVLTKQMRDVSHDMHLELVYSQAVLPQHSTGPTPEGLARYREAMEQENCTFEKVEVLSNNIGYLKLNSFPDPSVCRSTATAAMASLNHADAIIFDLRDNRGGEPEMVAMVAAYLFDHPEYMYNPRENTTQHSWTISPVPGNELADKPAYVLISRQTFSGAEQFCYDLKMLKRATLVGETTGGAAHSGVFHRIDDHFGMGIPETKPINPFSKTDWAETGVEPDVKVEAANALEAAKKLAESKLRKR
jgi:hypothetical protein